MGVLKVLLICTGSTPWEQIVAFAIVGFKIVQCDSFGKVPTVQK